MLLLPQVLALVTEEVEAAQSEHSSRHLQMNRVLGTRRDCRRERENGGTWVRGRVWELMTNVGVAHTLIYGSGLVAASSAKMYHVFWYILGRADCCGGDRGA